MRRASTKSIDSSNLPCTLVLISRETTVRSAWSEEKRDSFLLLCMVHRKMLSVGIFDAYFHSELVQILAQGGSSSSLVKELAQIHGLHGTPEVIGDWNRR